LLAYLGAVPFFCLLFRSSLAGRPIRASHLPPTVHTFSNQLDLAVPGPELTDSRRHYVVRLSSSFSLSIQFLPPRVRHMVLRFQASARRASVLGVIPLNILCGFSTELIRSFLKGVFLLVPGGKGVTAPDRRRGWVLGW